MEEEDDRGPIIHADALNAYSTGFETGLYFEGTTRFFCERAQSVQLVLRHRENEVSADKDLPEEHPEKNKRSQSFNSSCINMGFLYKGGLVSMSVMTGALPQALTKKVPATTQFEFITEFLQAKHPVIKNELLTEEAYEKITSLVCAVATSNKLGYKYRWKTTKKPKKEGETVNWKNVKVSQAVIRAVRDLKKGR